MRRRRLLIAAGVTAMLLVGSCRIIFLRPAAARPPGLPQAQIEAQAVATAQEYGLQGLPTGVASHKITLEQFRSFMECNTIFDAFRETIEASNDNMCNLQTQQWIVWVQGDLQVEDGGRIVQRDNIWVQIGTDGDVKGLGVWSTGASIPGPPPLPAPRAP